MKAIITTFIMLNREYNYTQYINYLYVLGIKEIHSYRQIVKDSPKPIRLAPIVINNTYTDKILLTTGYKKKNLLTVIKYMQHL